MVLFQCRNDNCTLPITSPTTARKRMFDNLKHSMYPQQEHSFAPAAHQHVMTEKKYNKLHSSSSNSISPRFFSRWLSDILILLFSISFIFYYESSGKKLNSQFQGMLTERSNLTRRLDQLSRETTNEGENDRRLEAELEEALDLINRILVSTTQLKTDLETENDALYQMIDESMESDGGVGEGLMEASYEESNALSEWKDMIADDRVNALKEYIQNESRREVLDRWGPGPHQIRLDLEFPEDKDSQQQSRAPPRHLTIELAPLQMMPHTIHLFLEQVSHGLWEGCSFLFNTDHIIQAGPFSGDGPLKDNTDRFKNAKLNKLAFQEYHHSYPHDQYTMGFAGRTGGTEFYINMRNNTHIHGPGGQKHHDLEDEADPCFAKVVDGFDTLEIMERRPTNVGRFERRILIKSTTIVPMSDSPNGRNFTNTTRVGAAPAEAAAIMNAAAINPPNAGAAGGAMLYTGPYMI